MATPKRTKRTKRELKLKNVQLTSIKRLFKVRGPIPMVDDPDWGFNDCKDAVKWERRCKLVYAHAMQLKHHGREALESLNEIIGSQESI